MAKVKKFSVYICKDESCVKITEIDDVIKACSIALNVHQVSNQPHSVVVYDESEDSNGVRVVDINSEN